MKFTGIELKYFRSIGENGVMLSPLKKCNLVIGQNNSGKSNVLRAVEKIFQVSKDNVNISLDPLDFHNRSDAIYFRYKLFFKLDNDHEWGGKLREMLQEDEIWFEFEWRNANRFHLIDFSLTKIADFNLANSVLLHTTGRTWGQRVSQEDIKKEFIRLGSEIFIRHFFNLLSTTVHYIHEFRQIRPGENYTLDGTDLIKTLAEYRVPSIGNDHHQIRFEKIERFAKKLLHLPNAILEVSPTNPTIIIKNDGLRLPLASYGTGAHELIILLTAVLSFENSIFCIEEPEIHLHPRMQREFIDFLIAETSNQYFISTHSHVFIDSVEENDQIQAFKLTSIGGKTIGGPILNHSESLQVINDLGLHPSDLLQTNCIVWVEGFSDRTYIKRWIDLFAPDLLEGRDYSFMYYSELPKLHIDREEDNTDGLVDILRINQNAVLIMDSDRSNSANDISEQKRKIKQNCEQSGVPVWVTHGREIENYIPAAVIKLACKDLRNVEIEPKMDKFGEFERIVDSALKKAGASPLDYGKHKKEYAKKFAAYFLIENIDSELREKLDMLCTFIRSKKD